MDVSSTCQKIQLHHFLKKLCYTLSYITWFSLFYTADSGQAWSLKCQHATLDTHTYLVILQFSAYNSEGIVYEVVVDVDFWEAVWGPRGHPFLVDVVVNHHRGPSRGNALLGTFITGKQRRKLIYISKILNGCVNLKNGHTGEMKWKQRETFPVKRRRCMCSFVLYTLSLQAKSWPLTHIVCTAWELFSYKP